MDELKALIIFIEFDIFSNIYDVRKKVYFQTIKENFYNQRYSDVFLLGVSSNGLIKCMDWIKPKLPFQQFWTTQFEIGKSAYIAGIGAEYNFESNLLDKIVHINCLQIDYFVDYCSRIPFSTIEELTSKIKELKFKISELDVNKFISMFK